MARTKGAKNKPKESVAQSEAPPGHNRPPGELTDDQRRALAFQHKREFKAALEKKKKADADFKNACKRIKSEGSSLERIKALITLEEPSGEKSLRALIESTLEAMRWAGVETGESGDLFAEDRRPATDRAFSEGKVAGLEGKDPKAPHDPSVPQHESWMQGWHAGQAVNRELLAGMKMPEQIDDDEFDKAAPAAE